MQFNNNLKCVSLDIKSVQKVYNLTGFLKNDAGQTDESLQYLYLKNHHVM